MAACTPTLVATATGAIQSIAIDTSASVYWTIGGPSGGVFIQAGTSQTPLSTSENDPRGIAVGSNALNAYWVDFGSGAVVKEAIALGTPSKTIVPLVNPPDAGPSPGPVAIAVDANNVYWVEFSAGNVMQLAIGDDAGTASPIQLATGQSIPISIAVDAQYVYWLDYGAQPGGGSVNRVPIGGGTIQPLATGLTRPQSVALDATQVYWTSHTNSAPVLAISKNAALGTQPVVIAQNQALPYGIVVDTPAQGAAPGQAFVYWTNFNGNTVSRAPVPGTGTPGSVAVLASGQNGPAAMAMDSQAIYWANQGNGQIMRLAIPK